jgi:hypothetical protein
MSGNEKSQSDADENFSYSNNNNVKSSNMRTSNKGLRNSTSTIAPKNYEVSDRLYPKSKIKSKKNETETNTDFNNKRFDKDKEKVLFPYSENMPIVKEEPFNNKKKLTNLNKSKNNKIIPVNTRYNLDKEFEKYEKEIKYEEEDIEDEEEEVRKAPKPIGSSSNSFIGINNKENVKLNDFKKVKKNINNTSNNNQPYLYMPDFLASKLVDDIMKKTK